MSVSQESDLQKAGTVEEVSCLQLQKQVDDNSPHCSPELLETSKQIPLRPRTRSQTVSNTKRRLTEDSPPSQKTVAPRKKTKPPPKKTSSPIDTESNEDATTTNSPMDSKATLQDTTRASSPVVSTPTYTFLESSSSPGAAEKRGPRSRASLPVPVPNLTKRSRGRRVPTQETVVEGDPMDKRLYVCNVEGCGKCFHRGEHLKRHIRSIHTHEKPFKCTHPTCGKFFNRHDNLLQHLKVHRQDCEINSLPPPKSSPTSHSSSPESMPALRRDINSSISDSDISESHMTVPQINSTFSPVPIVFNPYVSSAQFDISCESFSTNMAVSSLRTELPAHSPPSSRARDAK